MDERFQLALERLDSTRWHLFEQLASQFMADIFPDLRTMASASGDGGRDSVLYSCSTYPRVALQYSVSEDTRAKVHHTARTLKAKHPNIDELIFLTNRLVTAKDKDDLQDHLRKHDGLSLDIRDQNWFLERQHRSPQTEDAAQKVIDRIVLPLLSDRSLGISAQPTLTDEDSRSAMLFLALQREDDQRDRGLTKLCYDAIVKAILRGTDTENRLGGEAVREAARRITPSHDEGDVDMYVDRALKRLERRAIRHHTADDSYCLNYEERQRLADAIARLSALEQKFMAEIHEHVNFACKAVQPDVPADYPSICERARRVLETFLLRRGESFASAIAGGQLPLFHDDELHDVAVEDLIRFADSSTLRHNLTLIVETVLRRILEDPGPETLRFLRTVSDSYTLFAFFRETPNVQAAITKVFSGGELVLDTSVILPMLAEQLLDRSERRFSRLFEAARHAGVRLTTTGGVIEELVAHLQRCRVAARVGPNFRGKVPFLYNAFVWAGGEPARFGNFVEEFTGERRPEADLKAYLAEELHIHFASFDDEINGIEDQLRWAVTELWREVHAGRRDSTVGDDVIQRLVEHDVESFLGVVERRGGEAVGNPLGYSTWWLTLDSKAQRVAGQVSERTGVQLDNPIMSLDALTYYLAVGEARKQLDAHEAATLPLSVETGLLEALPAELADAAARARAEAAGASGRVLRRKLRDMLEGERLREGRIGRVGVESIEHDIQVSLQGKSG